MVHTTLSGTRLPLPGPAISVTWENSFTAILTTNAILVLVKHSLSLSNCKATRSQQHATHRHDQPSNPPIELLSTNSSARARRRGGIPGPGPRRGGVSSPGAGRGRIVEEGIEAGGGRWAGERGRARGPRRRGRGAGRCRGGRLARSRCATTTATAAAAAATARTASSVGQAGLAGVAVAGQAADFALRHAAITRGGFTFRNQRDFLQVWDVKDGRGGGNRCGILTQCYTALGRRGRRRGLSRSCPAGSRCCCLSSTLLSRSSRDYKVTKKTKWSAWSCKHWRT